MVYIVGPMPSVRPTTTIRLTDEDREILEKLQERTGLESAAAVIRLSIRESLAVREIPRPRMAKERRR